MKILMQIVLFWWFVVAPTGGFSGTVTVIGPFETKYQCETYREQQFRFAKPCWSDGRK